MRVVYNRVQTKIFEINGMKVIAACGKLNNEDFHKSLSSSNTTRTIK
jgi:hypothetical protein